MYKKIMKRLLLTVSMIVLMLGLTAVTAGAATTQHGLADYMYITDGEKSVNISLHKYNRFQSKEDQSYLLKNDNGGYTRLEFIKQGVDVYDEYGLFIEEYDKSFNLKSTKEVKMPYPIFGGVCFGEDYNFLFSSQINTWEEDDFIVMYIQIFDKEWTKEIDRLAITNNSLGATDPLDRIYTAFGIASNLQMAEIGDNYYFHFGYKMCQAPEEYGQKIFHQLSGTYVLKNTDSGWKFEMFPQIHVIHSWNQFITTDGEYLYMLDQEDGDSEGKEQEAGIYYQKVAKDSTAETGIKSYKLHTKQTYEAYQFTGTSLGSLKLIGDTLFTAGNSEEYYDRPADLRDSHFNQRNIFVDLIDKNFTKDTYSRNWITEYPVVYETHEDYIDVGNPYIVTTDTEYQYVIWSEYIKKTDTRRLGIAKINMKGERAGDIHYIYGHLSDADPLYVDGNLVWYVTGYYEGNSTYSTTPVFYRVNIADLEAGKYDYTESYKTEDLSAKLESYEVPYDSRSSINAAKVAAVTLDGKGYQLVEGVDYTVSYENNLKLSKDAGPAKAVINGRGMFAGTKKVDYQVVANDIGKQGYKLILNPDTVAYDPKVFYQQKPKYTVVDADGEIFDNSGSVSLYTVGDNKNMKNAGVVTFAYTPETYGYEGTVTADFTIEKGDPVAAGLEIYYKNVSQARVEYTGKPIEPELVVSVGESNEPFTVTYKNNVEVGTGTAIITPLNYHGTYEKTFEIVPKKFTGIKATGWFGEYDGKPHSITLTGVPEGATVTYSLDGKTYTSVNPVFIQPNTETNASGAIVYYKVSMPNYQDFTGFTRVQVREPKAPAHTCIWDEGTVTKEATCTNSGVIKYECTYPGCTKTKTEYPKKLDHNYVVNKGVITPATEKLTGSVKMGCSTCTSTKTVTVAKIDSKSIKLATTSYTYTGKAKKPSVTVKDTAKKKLIVNTDYKVTYKNNTKVGKATATITFKGKYKGTKTLTFKINPKATALSSVKASSKSAITVKWKKQAVQTTGYEIMYSTSSTFKKGSATKTVVVSKPGTTAKSITKLTKNKRYYFKIRTYKTVNKVKYYSAWSAPKNVKTKSR